MFGQSGGDGNGNVDRIIFDFSRVSPVAIVIIIFGIFLYTLFVAWLFSKMISRTTSSSHELITALSLLTFVALTAAIITTSTAMETIAATGIGAIAGAVSHRFIGDKKEVNDDGGSISDEVDKKDL